MNLAAILDAFCVKRQQDDTAARSAVNKFRMSDAGKCRLMRYWKRQGKPATLPMSPEVIRAMQVGIILHDFVGQVIAQHYLASGGTRLEGELQDEHRIGHYDALVQTVDGSILYDIKTINEKKAYMEKNNTTAADLQHQHQHQIVTYASMLITPRPDTLLIAYIERGSLRVIRECTINYEQQIQSVQADWRALINAWEEQREPLANPDAAWECTYCGYGANCPQKQT